MTGFWKLLALGSTVVAVVVSVVAVAFPRVETKTVTVSKQEHYVIPKKTTKEDVSAALNELFSKHKPYFRGPKQNALGLMYDCVNYDDSGGSDDPNFSYHVSWCTRVGGGEQS